MGKERFNSSSFDTNPENNLSDPSEHSDQDDMEWDLFEESIEKWFRKRHPDWSNETINEAVNRVIFGGLIDEYEKHKKQGDLSTDQLEKLRKEIEELRDDLDDKDP